MEEFRKDFRAGFAAAPLGGGYLPPAYFETVLGADLSLTQVAPAADRKSS